MKSFASYNNWMCESIKHLKPRSEEEIRSYLKNLSPKEKLKTGAKEGLSWLVKDALDAGANVHANDDWALQLASEYGYAEVVKVLLDAGADVHAKNDEALQLASEYGYTEIVKVLLDAGADVHAWNDDALRYASYYGHVEVVKVLLDAGADVHAKDDWALRYASYYGHVEVVKLLKQYSKKKVNESIKHLTPKSEEEIRNSLRNLTTLEKFQEACEHGFVWLFKEAMKEEEININTEMGVHASIISDIFYYGRIELAKYLIEKHNLNIHKDHEGPLRWAIWNFQDINFLLLEGKIKLAEYLLELGADIRKAYEHANYNGYSEQVNSIGHFMKLKNIKKNI